MYILEISLTTLAVGLLTGLWLLHRKLHVSIAKRSAPAELERYPSVTVIRPIKGLDAGAADNFRAALDHGYPGDVETIFVFDDEDEPALPLCREAMVQAEKAGLPGESKVVFCGAPPSGRTGKLNAMIVALRQARNELIVFADSDIRPDEDGLKTLVGALLTTEKAGSAFAPVVVTPRPQTVGDAGYALLLNGMYSPAAELAAQRADYKLPFIMGQFMVFTREALDAIGGLESAEGQFVDDMYLGARVTAAGYHNVVSPGRVPIIQHGVSTKEFVGIYDRWLTFGRTGLPDWSFKLPPALQGVAFWFGLLGAGVSAALGLWLAAGISLAAALSVSLSMGMLHHRLGGAKPTWRTYVGANLVMLLAPVVFFGVYFKSEVTWRGRSYKLNGDSRLADGNALAPDELRHSKANV
jgi:ceramide glucosyltransferase